MTDNNTKKNKIIVSFTSWEKRIKNCAHTVDLMKEQTLKPDKIILNLSSDEFKNKEKDLPQDLIEKQDDIFEINWVKENTKVYKKIIPTMEKYPNDIIVSIDDDIDYPNNAIETLYACFEEYNEKYPVTSGAYQWENHIYTHYGAASMFKTEMFQPYFDDLYNNVVLKYGIDKIPFNDLIFTYSVLLNNNKYIFNEKLNLSKIRDKSKKDKENAWSKRGTVAYKNVINN